MTKKRFYIDTEGNDDDAYKEAMQYACKLAGEDPEIKNVILLIPFKLNTGWFERLFGSETVKQLHKGMRFKGCNPLYKFESVKSYNEYRDKAEIVIACGLNTEQVEVIDDYYTVKAIIAIPWLKDSLQTWVQKWDPLELRGSEKEVNIFPAPSCIVKKACQDLSQSINMSTGIMGHPSDEHLAKTYILALHKYEPILDANIVGTYLVKDLHWATSDAKDVEKLINTLNEGRHFKGGAKTGLQDYYRGWKEECK